MDALGGAVGICLQLAHLGGKDEHFQQIVHAHARFGGDGAHDGVAARSAPPSCGTTARPTTTI